MNQYPNNYVGTSGTSLRNSQLNPNLLNPASPQVQFINSRINMSQKSFESEENLATQEQQNNTASTVHVQANLDKPWNNDK